MRVNRLSLFRILGAACFIIGIFAAQGADLLQFGWPSWGLLGLTFWILDGSVTNTTTP
jgi:hypothetical protein